MDLVQGILNPTKPALASLVIMGVLIAVGLIANNSNTQNKTGISALGADTTVVGPFSYEEISALYKQWALDVLSDGGSSGGYDTIAANYVFSNIQDQLPLYGNVLSNNDVFFQTFGGVFNNIQTVVTRYGYGWYVILNLQDATGASATYPFKVVRNLDPTLQLTPSNFSTTPLQYKLVALINYGN